MQFFVGRLVVLAMAGAAAAPTGNTCAVLGCTTHKADNIACQCNFHCHAHKDCCEDVASVCLNQSDPCLAPTHGCKGGHGSKDAGNSTATAKAGGGGKASGNSTKAGHAGKEGSASAKAGHDKAAAAASDKKAPASAAAKSDAAKSDGKQGSHHEHTPAAAAKGKGDGSAPATSKSAGGSGGGSGGSGGGKAAEGGKAVEGGKEHTKKEGAAEAGGAKKEDKGASGGGDKKASHEHEHDHSHEGHAGGQHASVSWVIVLLACLTGLFVPITVAIVLVLRARGVCCAKHPHQRVDAQKPAETGISIEGEPNLGTGEEEAAAEPGLSPAVEGEQPKAAASAPVE